MTTFHATPQSLLSDQWQRRQCQAVLDRNGKYYDGPAERSTIVEAIGLLKCRADRRSQRGIAEKARRGPEPGRILRLGRQREAEKKAAAERRERARLERLKKRIRDGKISSNTLRLLYREGKLHQWLNRAVNGTADAIVRELAKLVGPIGEQCERDLAELRTAESFDGKKSRHHLYTRTSIDHVYARRDFSALLIRVCEYRSWGRGGDNGYEKAGGCSWRAYLIVRDATTGEAHCLRVPPKFARSDSQIGEQAREADWTGKTPRRPRFMTQAQWDRYESRRAQHEAENRIHAAVAWTFDLRPNDYRPTREA